MDLLQRQKLRFACTAEAHITHRSLQAQSRLKLRCFFVDATKKFEMRVKMYQFKKGVVFIQQRIRASAHTRTAIIEQLDTLWDNMIKQIQNKALMRNDKATL